jgi:tRNA pseudouridine32 synthase/23S rRNA pseudouridine746 synthase
LKTYFQYFATPITEIELPTKFTFPFYYEPHALCEIAANEVQDYLKTQTDFKHNFGLNQSKTGLVIGKMFGVLVVQNQQGEMGYITAVSGKLAEVNIHEKFVPPVFDMLTKDSFFLNEEQNLNAINKELETIENNSEYIKLGSFLKEEYLVYNKDISEKKEQSKTAKRERSIKRENGKENLNTTEFNSLVEALSKESLESKYFLNNVTRYWNYRLNETKDKIAVFSTQIETLKEERKTKSAALQQYLFDQYQFLNSRKLTKGLSQLFAATKEQNPPAGAGECAAPKLLQYAFLHDLKPIALAEFWWGQSPNTEIRKHQQFYPACQGKCKPILTHMLDGIEMDTNPMLQNPAIGKEFEIVFEDDDLLVINKPSEFLSVPGIHIQDSIYTRVKQQYPTISGPIIIHRLDMSTSGLLVVAKNKTAHKELQRQFINRTVKKRYVALLDGIVSEDKGTINLPLRVDLDDRPRQLVCSDHGKHAETNWKVIERIDNKTRVYLYPITGRTHQLRMHTSHKLGLNIPIVGDDLYGKKANRLHLHAEFIEFSHPTTKEKMVFQIKAEF